MIPAFYDYKNEYNSSFSPSTVHIKNTGLAWYFKRYLLEKILSVFKFKRLPDTWAKDYFMYVLFLLGKIVIFRTDKYGVIPQKCSLSGYDIFYRPTTPHVANPLISNVQDLKIGVNCEIIKLQPDWGGIWDIVDFYGDLLALCAESLGVNFVNSKFAYVFASSSKNGSESFKKMMDEIVSGQPAVFIDKSLYDEEGNPNWQVFNNNLANNYIADKILEDMAKIDSRFDTDIGIPNVNIAKESGVSDAEIRANDLDTNTKCVLWLETMREGIEKVNRMFDLDIDVSLRFYKGGETFERGNDNGDSVI